MLDIFGFAMRGSLQMAPFESCVENQRNDNFVIMLKFFRKPFSIQFDELHPGYYLEHHPECGDTSGNFFM